MEGIMDAWREWIRSAGEAAAARLGEPVESDPAVMIGMYAVCGLWLVHLWRIRNRPEGRDHITRAIELGDAIFGVLAAVALLGLGLLIALARASGRTPGERWLLREYTMHQGRSEAGR
jgi:hypothetical protein